MLENNVLYQNPIYIIKIINHNILNPQLHTENCTDIQRRPVTHHDSRVTSRFFNRKQKY